MLERFPDVSGLLTNVMTALGWPGSFWEEPLKTMFDLVMSMFSGKEGFQKERNQKFLNPIVNHSVKSLEEENIN